MTRIRFLSLLAGAATALATTGVIAQSGSPPETRVMLYFWIAGFEGTVGAGARTSHGRLWQQ
jgi:hypothetical protein